MTPENFNTTLEALLSTKPFKVFTVEMADGQRVEIDYPSVAFRDGVAVFTAEGGRPTIIKHYEVTRFIPDSSSLLITSPSA